ncbi:hypothetical protein L596_002888 [Steinernema carpocapsae]|uniref:Uncharacterized protein n=1 Tax=Steinernema carpocapsae TaxID=34508 RepID=A0A4U8USE5_STECR|nr:hypothetical protein L596_002888 [Steinernema carpocapsae]
MFWDQPENQSFSDGDAAVETGAVNFFNQRVLSLSELLDREDVQLCEIIDHDYVLTELRNGTEDRLIEYLSDSKIMMELLSIMLEPSDATDEIMQLGRSSKCGSMVAMRNIALTEAIVGNEDAMKYLRSYLINHRGRFNSNQMQYYKEAIFAAIVICPEKVLGFLQDNTNIDYLESLLQEMYHTPAADILLRLLKMIPSGDFFLYSKTKGCEYDKVLKWLMEADVPSKLLSLLSPEQPSLVHSNVAHVFVEMIHAVRGKSCSQEISEETRAFYKSFFGLEALKRMLNAIHGADVGEPSGRSIVRCLARIMNAILMRIGAEETPSKYMVQTHSDLQHRTNQLGGITREEREAKHLIEVVLLGLEPCETLDKSVEADFRLAMNDFLVSEKPIHTWLSKIICFLEQQEAMVVPTDTMWSELLNAVVHLIDTNNEEVYRSLSEELTMPLDGSFFMETSSDGEKSEKPVLHHLFRMAAKFPECACLHDVAARLLTILLFASEGCGQHITNIFQELTIFEEAMDQIDTGHCSTHSEKIVRGFWFRILLALRVACLCSPLKALIASSITGRFQKRWDDFCAMQLNEHIQKTTSMELLDPNALHESGMSSNDAFEIERMPMGENGGFPEDPLNARTAFDFDANCDADLGNNPFDDFSNSPFLGAGSSTDDPFAPSGSSGGNDGWATF